LTQSEILHVLKATLKLDNDRLEKNLPSLFLQWDPNGDGCLEFDEVMGPKGLFYYVRDAFRASGQSTECPSIRQDRALGSDFGIAMALGHWIVKRSFAV
jgi:hypothetical protein